MNFRAVTVPSRPHMMVTTHMEVRFYFVLNLQYEFTLIYRDGNIVFVSEFLAKWCVMRYEYIYLVVW